MSDEFLGFIQSGDQAISTELVLKSLTPYDRHLMRQPFLQDFVPRLGQVSDEHIQHFRNALELWLEEEKILRARWSGYSPENAEPLPREANAPAGMQSDEPAPRVARSAQP